MPGLSEETTYNEEERRAISDVKREVLRRIPRGMTPADFFGAAVRRAIDEVLSLSENRFHVDQLAPPEQAYIGTRSEIIVREELDLGIGSRADTIVAGHEVDLKWSRRLNWMIGPENLGTVCLGIGTDKTDERLSVGLFVPRADRLGGQNRDRKFMAGSKFRKLFVDWIVEDAALPLNFIATLPDDVRDAIMVGDSAQERMRRLAELVPYKPVPREALRYVSQNKADFMRRIREDRGRLVPPLGTMVCLSARYRRDILGRLGIVLRDNEFIFVPREDYTKALVDTTGASTHE